MRRHTEDYEDRHHAQALETTDRMQRETVVKMTIADQRTETAASSFGKFTFPQL
jgi:hypothetical protein